MGYSVNQTTINRCRIRIRYAKRDHLRFMGHRDLIRTLERIFRRAEVELAMSEGFHPRPRMRFCEPLAVGQAGTDEVMDLEIVSPCNPDELLNRLNHLSVPGLEFTQIDPLDASEKKLRAKSFWYEIDLDPEVVNDTEKKVRQFLLRPTYQLQKQKSGVEIDIRPLVLDLRVKDQCLMMHLAATQEAGVRPIEILELLGVSPVPSSGTLLTRTAVQL